MDIRIDEMEQYDVVWRKAVQFAPTRSTLNQRPDRFSTPADVAANRPTLRGGPLTIAGVTLTDRSMALRVFKLMAKTRIAGYHVTELREKTELATLGVRVIWACGAEAVFYGVEACPRGMD
jgi:hypothetical protein